MHGNVQIEFSTPFSYSCMDLKVNVQMIGTDHMFGKIDIIYLMDHLFSEMMVFQIAE